MPSNQQVRRHRPRGGSYDPVRSVRVGETVWEKAKRRAALEGVTMSYVLSEIAEGYAEGSINLPRVTKTFAKEA